MAESSIYDLHIDCMDAFRQLRESLKSFHWSSQVPQTALKLRAVEEELDRYQLWATNTGAASPRQEFSLDFRLQETELLRGQTIRLLQSLRRTIMRASSVATGPLQPTLSALAFPENSIDDTGLVEKFDSDSPWDTSDDADSSEGMEINRDASTQHEGVMGQGIINQIPQCVADVDQLLGTIKYTVICLYRLPLRRPAAVDRAKWVTDELGDVSLFQHFDILYVKDKFPNAQTALLERLGKLISRRRLLLKYRTTHAQKLRLVASSRTEPQVHRQPEPVESPPTHEAPARWKGKQPMNISSSLSTSDRLTTRTKASFLKRDEDIIDPRQLYAPSVASSRLSAASTYTTSQDLHFPPRPTDDEGEPLTHFECPYCGITQYITSSQAWESHVIRDLQPYVCTFDSCDSGDQLFSSRSDWFNHEIQLHRAIWSCKTCPPTASSSHPYLAFENETDFKEHMIHVHGSGTRMTTRMLEAFCQPLLVQDGICCLCGRHAEKLKNHLGRHLEQISLFALPRPEPTAALGMDSVIIGVANQGGSYDELLKGTAGSSWRTASDRESESYKDPLHTAHNPLFEGQSRPGRERKNPLTDLRLLYPERGDADAQVDIVLVHGFAGHYIETWQAEDGCVWPRDLLPASLHDISVRVWSFQYHRTIKSVISSAGISNNANDLLQALYEQRETNEGQGDVYSFLKHIIWIGHSLGGIIIKKALCIANDTLRYRSLWSVTQGVMFFATPHQGLDRMGWRRFALEPLLQSAPFKGLCLTKAMMEKLESNLDVFLDITQDFRRLQNQLCFFNITEQVPMTGPTELLVDQTTGTMMDASSESRFSLARDHIGICKFTFDDEQLFRLVVAEGIKALLRSKPKTAEIDDKFHPFSPIIGSEDTEPNFISKPGEASTKQGLEAMDVSLPARTKTSELDQLATSNRDPHTTVDVEVERVPVVVKKVIKEVDVEVERMPVERVPVERVPMEVNEITVVKETIKEVFIDNPGLHRTPEFDAAKSTEHLDRTDSDNVKVRYFGRVKKVGKFFNKIFR